MRRTTVDLAGTQVGLRLDVDTLRGTRDGVPWLLEQFAQWQIKASIFFSVGPDNMGRHLLRLIRPRFLSKMLRSRAASLYGWDILLRGTFGEGPLIAKRCPGVLRDAAEAGHEIGLHAWDHHRWQTRLGAMTYEQIRAEIERGLATLEATTGRRVGCVAAPGWRCTDDVLRAEAELGLDYASDCRGENIFRPLFAPRASAQGTLGDEPIELAASDQVHRPAPVQIPVTLPTYDEVIGSNEVSDANYNQTILGLLRPGGFNVLTIHAEVEGLARRSLFAEFVRSAQAEGIMFRPLGELLNPVESSPHSRIVKGAVAGRDGWVATQSKAASG